MAWAIPTVLFATPERYAREAIASYSLQVENIFGVKTTKTAVGVAQRNEWTEPMKSTDRMLVSTTAFM